MFTGAIVLVLVLLNGVFVLSELAVASARVGISIIATASAILEVPGRRLSPDAPRSHSDRL